MLVKSNGCHGWMLWKTRYDKAASKTAAPRRRPSKRRHYAHNNGGHMQNRCNRIKTGQSSRQTAQTQSRRTNADITANGQGQRPRPINALDYPDILGMPQDPKDKGTWKGLCVVDLSTEAVGVVEGMRGQKLMCMRTTGTISIQKIQQTIKRITRTNPSKPQCFTTTVQDVRYFIPRSFQILRGFQQHKL